MQEFWLRALEAMDEAEDRARELRRRFGTAAEARCADEIATFAPHDPRRHRVEDVRRALRWV
jgi:hypothetical protein